MPLSSLIGPSGEIFALDLHPLAIKSVKNIASKNKLENVKTIHSECDTGLPDQSVDVALLYDTYHDLNNPDDVLQEINRILKTEGILSFSDHHMKDYEIKEKILSNNLFKLIKKNRKRTHFQKSTNKKEKNREINKTDYYLRLFALVDTVWGCFSNFPTSAVPVPFI